MNLHGAQIWSWVADSTARCRSRLWVASAYVRASRLRLVSNKIAATDIDKIIVSRWDLMDLLSGASDLSAYQVAKEHGWRFLINQDLHAKVYVFDSVCGVGSANLTERGMLGKIPPGNNEVISINTDVGSISSWFRQLIASSTELNADLYNQISLEVGKNKDLYDSFASKSLKFSDDLLLQLNAGSIDTPLYTYEMFWTNPEGNAEQLRDKDGDSLHDSFVLGLSDLEEASIVKERFVASTPFQWLLKNVDDFNYYGQLSSLLHDALKDDPAPYRKDVKILLSNLLGWTSAYGKDYFIIDRPGKSQRVRRI